MKKTKRFCSINAISIFIFGCVVIKLGGKLMSLDKTARRFKTYSGIQENQNGTR